MPEDAGDGMKEVICRKSTASLAMVHPNGAIITAGGNEGTVCVELAVVNGLRMRCDTEGLCPRHFPRRSRGGVVFEVKAVQRKVCTCDTDGVVHWRPGQVCHSLATRDPALLLKRKRCCAEGC